MSKPQHGAHSDAINLGAVEINVSDYVSQGNAILGIRDSGKSYTATYLAEQLLARDIPFVAFDPIGVWRFMRYGKRQWAFLIAGGASADIPITRENCMEIVRYAMKAKISVVFDLYDMSVPKSDWRWIVEHCVRVLLYENKDHGRRHIFIEEAAEFVPQLVRGEHACVYAEIEKLARMGGNAMLGYTLINQRAEQLNKAVLELCDCLFLHRQKGRLSLTALTKWLDFGDPKAATPVIKSLPMLEQGKCWVWGNGSDRPELTKIPAKQSFHPNRREHTDPGPKLEVPWMIPKLHDEPERKKVQGFKPAAAPAELPVKEVPVFAPGDLAKLEEARREMDHTCSQLDAMLAEAAGIAKTLRDCIQRADAMMTPRKAYVPPLKVRQENGAPTTLAKGPQKILQVLASRYPARLTFAQLGTLSGFTPSTMRTYFPGLRTDGLIEENSDGITISDKGLNGGGFDTGSMPAGGKGLLEFWKSKLSLGEGTILQVLYDQRRSCGIEALSEMTGYTASTIRTYLPALRRNRLIDPIENQISREFL